MARAKLDRIDRRILSDLQANGRMTNVELAERAGISAPPCLRRVRALERAGIIKGYHAELSPEALGYSVSVFALVGLNSQAETDLKAFEELVAKLERDPRVPHAGGRSRLPAEDRRRDLGRVSEVPDHATHLGAQCQPREVDDGVPHRQAACPGVPISTE